MRFYLALSLLVPSIALAQAPPQTVYEITQPIVTNNGAFTLPWGGAGFSMDQRAFIVQELPPCAGNWTLIPPGTDTRAYPVIIQVDPLPVGTTLYAPQMGVIPLGNTTDIRQFACFSP